MLDRLMNSALSLAWGAALAVGILLAIGIISYIVEFIVKACARRWYTRQKRGWKPWYVRQFDRWEARRIP